MRVSFEVSNPKVGEDIAVALGRLAVDKRIRATKLRDGIHSVEKAKVSPRRKETLLKWYPRMIEACMTEAMEMDRIGREIAEQIQEQRTWGDAGCGSIRTGE